MKTYPLVACTQLACPFARRYAAISAQINQMTDNRYTLMLTLATVAWRDDKEKSYARGVETLFFFKDTHLSYTG